MTVQEESNWNERPNCVLEQQPVLGVFLHWRMQGRSGFFHLLPQHKWQTLLKLSQLELAAPTHSAERYGEGKSVSR